uniref:Glutathione transferase n=1 Tax=Hemiselmis tepida TaxID=464990 RepID=A0A7S0Z0A6_9CRYP|mmetsp:Transcript_36304/g.92700  ORF Transcript_36304/g.92700 Transcript_36304/m.92700 type:complete len:147 (+) Transcript_36304:80-520(+)|eukprot:CAMPEP_0174926164 /NCGR_PEP_ID=MMETSP1355-20121228/10096_1 /TAXON_ID=464990 /ORGANISM="Hemiselmis tepida, Strain CCMP443" /LENGTH=146 /DNA_ID=CAMNT_0016172183 /DNA_START=59 /DNA_END=499 /DNA_ORIENTATION=-
MVTLNIPPEYGWTIIGCAVLPFVGLNFIGGMVMGARSKYNVQYPNLYAVPGVHKDADLFNQVQRGHQNALEQYPGFLALALVGGFKHPIANAIGGVLWTLGRYLYMIGYTQAAGKRYGKGAGIMWIGVLTGLISTGKLAYDLINSK